MVVSVIEKADDRDGGIAVLNQWPVKALMRRRFYKEDKVSHVII